MNAFVSVLGMDKKGIIREVSSVLATHNINILDLNQTIVKGYFTMIMFVDLTDMAIELKDLKEHLEVSATELKLTIKVQLEDIFSAMHNI